MKRYMSLRGNLQHIEEVKRTEKKQLEKKGLTYDVRDKKSQGKVKGKDLFIIILLHIFLNHKQVSPSFIFNG